MGGVESDAIEIEASRTIQSHFWALWTRETLTALGMLKAVPALQEVYMGGGMEGYGRPSSQEAAVMLQFIAAAAAQAIPNSSDHTSCLAAQATHSVESENGGPLPKRASPEPPSISCECTCAASCCELLRPLAAQGQNPLTNP
jgi:hypothetical protein|eukprot:COSAG02_NODE_95_length_37416_cov_60.512742_30_plen_143_part_00